MAAVKAATLTFSIVLCTRNRASLLATALESIRRLDYPSDACELVLVDNDSSDNTRQVVDAFAESAPFSVRYVHESKLGLSSARNRGLREARGRYVFFTDDDQEVDERVLTEHERVAVAHDAVAQQGSIQLRFSHGQPEWLRGDLAGLLGRTQDVPEGPTDIDLFGGNLIFRRDLFDTIEPFRVDLGKGQAGYSEDTELSERLRAANIPIIFAPTAVIYHVIGPDRASRRFLVQNSFEKGRSAGLILDLPVGVGTFARQTSKNVRWYAREFAANWRDDHTRVLAFSRAAYDLGRLAGYAAKRMRGRAPS